MPLAKTLRLFAYLGILFCLAACSSQQIEQAKQAESKEQADRRHAEAKLAMLLSTRKPRVEQEPEEEPLSEVPQYDAARLKKAGMLKRWAGVHVPEINIDAYLKTAWKDGRIDIRLALLGQKAALDLFNSSWTKYRVSFAAQDGTRINEVIIPTSEMHFARTQVNNNIPTLEFEGSQDCPLDVYEQSVQWNFEWEQ